MSTKRVKEIINGIKETKNFRQAFIHSSYANQFQTKSYETLEFLGDSVIGFATALYLYLNFPEFTEGKMSKLKQLMIRQNTLAQLTRECGLDKFLKLGSVEKSNRGKKKESIIADVFESFVAALYLEKGQKEVFEFLNGTLFKWVKDKENMIWDYKSQLQEFCQSEKNKVEYFTKETKKNGLGQTFIVEVSDELKKFQEIGVGKNKKEAEQDAAKKVIEKLKIIKEGNDFTSQEKIIIQEENKDHQA